MGSKLYKIAASIGVIAALVTSAAPAVSAGADGPSSDGRVIRISDDQFVEIVKGDPSNMRASAAALADGFVPIAAGSTNLGAYSVDLVTGSRSAELRPWLEQALTDIQSATDLAGTPNVSSGALLPLTPGTTPYRTWDVNNDIGEIIISTDNTGSPCGANPGILGCTSTKIFVLDNGDVIDFGAQMWINSSAFEGDDTALVRGTITHEMGHALGLGHFGDADPNTGQPTNESYYKGEVQLMYPYDSPGLVTYRAGDINGLRYVDPPDGRFVRKAFYDFLGRAPDLDGYSYWYSGLVVDAITRADVALGLAKTNEWIGKIIEDLYQDTLGRAADAPGKTYWTGRIQAGMSVADVAGQFYGSNEYFSNIGGGTVPTWIDDLYVKLLGRAADTGGRGYWTAQTNARGRVSVATEFFQTLESRRARVTGLYQSLLGRGPDPVGRDYWAGQVLTQGDIALAASLAGSDEYLAKTRAYES